MEHLLDAGADVNVYDEHGTSFLAWVVLTGSLYVLPVIASHLRIEWLNKELPVISAAVELKEKQVIDPLRSRQLFSLALMYAIAQTKEQLSQDQRGAREDGHDANVPEERPTWLPSEELFPAMLFARNTNGTQADDKTLKRAKKKCIEICGISPWDPPKKTDDGLASRRKAEDNGESTYDAEEDEDI
jgi:hypothetical protein